MLSPTILPLAPNPALAYKSLDGVLFLYDPVAGTMTYKSQCRDQIRWCWEFENANDGHRNQTNYRDVSAIIPYLGIAMGVKWDTAGFAARWYAMETTLGLSARTTIHETPVLCTAVLHVSPFWTANTCRRSLVTLFLRMLASYGRDTMDESIEVYPLAKTVAPAIKWFLAGNVVPTFVHFNRISPASPWHGFVNQAAGLNTPDELATLLVKPIAPDAPPYIPAI